jgi:hypothetical protein
MAELYADQVAWARAAAATIYIVESEERAQVIRASLDEGNANRAAQGQSPLNEQVLSFDSVEAEVQFWATHDAQQHHAGGNGVGNSVIDLRGRSRASCFEQDGTIPDVVRDTCMTGNAAQRRSWS